jgi:hypothetical protein
MPSRRIYAVSATVGVVALFSAFTGAIPRGSTAVNLSLAGSVTGTSVTVDHVVKAFGTGSATANVTNTGGHELAVAFVAGDQVYGSPPGQTAKVSGGGTTWTLSSRANTQMGTAEIWSQEGNGSTAFSVTATLAQNKNLALTVVTFQGSTATGASSTAASASGAPTVKLAPTVAGSRVYAVGFDWDNGIPRTVPAGQAMDSQTLDTAGDTYWVQHAKASTTGSQVTISDTAPTGDRWDMEAIEVVPTGGPPPTTTTTVPGSTTTTTPPGSTTTSSTIPATTTTSSTIPRTTTTSSTVPPTTTTTTPPGGKPNATNTGVPSGHDLLVLSSGVGAMTLPAANTSPAGCAGWDGGSLFTSRDGCTIHDVDATGGFLFTNNNTTLQYDKIHDANKNYPSVDNNYIIQASWSQNVGGAVIEDSEVYADSGISYGIAGSNFTLLRDNIHNANHDLQITGAGNVNVTGCYLHGIVSQSGDHTELAYLDSSPNVTFRGNNWVFNPSNGDVADIFSDGINGPGGPMVLDGNWWGGTGTQWVVHVDDPGSGLTFTNNRVAPTYGLALASFFGGTPHVTGGNTWDGSGTTPDYGNVVNGQEVPGL